MTKNEFIEKCKSLALAADMSVIPVIFFKPMKEGEELIPISPEKRAELEADRLYDFLEEHDLFKKEVIEEIVEAPTTISEILIVEDGSVNTERLEKMGFKIIVYRKGSNPPYFMKEVKND